MNRLLFLLGLLSVLFGGCAVEPPDWVHGQSAAYPTVAYLTAVGLAPARESAEKVAMHRLLSQLHPSPEPEPGAAAGGRIAEVWHDRRMDTFYALAVIARARAARPWLDHLASLDQAVAAQVSAAETAASPLRRWAHFLRAASLAAGQEQGADELRRIDPAAVVPPVTYSRRDLAGRRDGAAAAVGLDVRLRHDRDDAVSHGLIKALAERGLRLAPDFAAGLRLRGSVTAEDLPSGDPLRAVRIQIESDESGALEWPVIEETAEVSMIGERLAARIVAAVNSLATMNSP